MNTYDFSPSVAVASNGTIGVTWRHYLGDGSNHNDNIYFATLDGSGNLITGPTNITNNTAWGNWDTLNVPFYYYPTIATSDDNRFILGWEEFKNIGSTDMASNIWYTTRNTAGASVFPPAALTSDNISYVPVINSLTGGKAILTLKKDLKPYYAVINSNGSISKPVSSLGATGTINNYPIDAVLLPNGKVAAAWATTTGVQFSILNSAYTLESGPFSAANPNSEDWGGGLSVTTDIDSHVIMTWTAGDNNSLIYALGNSAGAFITPPMLYKTSADYIDISWNGQGNVPYSLPDGVDGVASLSADLVGGEPGSSVAVGIHYTNHGATTATGVTLTVTLDSNLIYVSDTSGVVPSVSGNTVTWNLPNMASLGGQDFTLNVGIPAGAALGTHYPISLSLTSNEPDINPGDNTDSAEVMAARQVFLPLIMR